MRIISGKHKGRRLMAPKKLPVRPTTDMSKEALFNILNNRFYFDDITVIDLFAGTGNIGYEFASRGCTAVTAVDADFGCIKYINATSKELELDIQTFRSDTYAFLEKTAITADVIFADPPYDFEVAQFLKVVDLVFENNCLTEEGLLIIEHSKRTDLTTHPHYSHCKRYGGNVFSFFEATKEE